MVIVANQLYQLEASCKGIMIYSWVQAPAYQLDKEKYFYVKFLIELVGLIEHYEVYTWVSSTLNQLADQFD